MFKSHRACDLIFFSVLGICLVLAGSSVVLAETVRKPAVAGTFYPDDPDRLTQMINELCRQAEKDRHGPFEARQVKALVMPHAGYVYSGLTAAHAAGVLEGRKFSKIIIMAPDHRVGFYGGAISDADKYQTPLGMIPVHPDADKLRQQYEFFKAVPASDTMEHSVEVILPFLQTWLKDFEIIPMVLGRSTNAETLASAVKTVLDPETLVIVSTDLSHYLPYDEAVDKDRKTIEYIEKLETEKLATERERACGMLPLLVLIKLAGSSDWKPRLVHYANSGDTAGGKDKVVGYATIAFYGEKDMSEHETEKQLSSEKGGVLLALARKSIAGRLGVPYESPVDLESRTKDPVFQSRRGTFVTLKIDGRLRGCIGNLVPEKTLVEGIRDNAANAAFNDPRFAPLSKEEFQQIQIEVSLLTEPTPLEYRDAQELLDRIRPDVDGLIIKKGPHSATFLPQVWEQLPDKKLFLSNLCMKAGLAPDEWEKGDLQVFTYQVQYFEENA